MTTTSHTLPITCGSAQPGVREVVAEHGDFLWKTLQRLGVREADLPDLLQEVLIVVHQRLGSYDTTRPMPPWLFGICIWVAVAHRRRAWVRREQAVSEVPEDPSRAHPPNPEEAATAAEARARVQRVLDAMDPERRAVFVMFEIEELSGEEIAAVMGVPKGTIWSRLHAARRQFEEILVRMNSRDERRGQR